MRLSLRFLVPLLVVLAAFAYAAVPLVDRLMQRWFERDVEIRSSFIANSVEEPIERLMADGEPPARLVSYFNRLARDERLYAIALCLTGSRTPIASERFPRDIDCESPAGDADGDGRGTVRAAQGALQLASRNLGTTGRIIIVHDVSFIERRSEETRRYLFYFFVALSAIVALITVVIAQLSWRGWVQGMRALLRGEGIWRPASGLATSELRPIERDVRELVRDLERQNRPRHDDGMMWTQDTLREALRRELHGNDIIVVSN
ncbi:MAG: trehalose-6-phosphate synthase, partial [Betaproteobacteria bacterium]